MGYLRSRKRDTWGIAEETRREGIVGTVALDLQRRRTSCTKDRAAKVHRRHVSIVRADGQVQVRLFTVGYTPTEVERSVKNVHANNYFGG